MPVLHKMASVEILIWMIFFTLLIMFNIGIIISIYIRLQTLLTRSRSVGGRQYSQVPSSMRSKHDIFVTIYLLLLASIFCRLPFPITGIIGFVAPAELIQPNTWYVLNAVLSLILYCNFLADPLISFYGLKDARQGLLEIITRNSHNISTEMGSIRMRNGEHPLQEKQSKETAL